MSVGLKIELRGNVTEAIEKKLAGLQPGAVAQKIGEPLRIYWRDRLKSLGTNKRGWPSTGFWESAARSVQSIAQPDGLILRCSKLGVRQRWQGGRITPQRAQALAIPISPVSYGHRPSEFTGLFLMKTRRGAYLVQRGQQLNESGQLENFREPGKGRRKSEARRRASGLHFLFKLSRGVNQRPNPAVVPTADELTEVILATLERSRS